METQNAAEVSELEAERLRRPPARDRLKESILSSKLKAERVQEMLQIMPAWGLVPGGKGIERAWTFGEASVAATFTAFVAANAHAAHHPVELFLDGKRLLITVWGPQNKGKRGGLTEAALHFAKKLG